MNMHADTTPDNRAFASATELVGRAPSNFWGKAIDQGLRRSEEGYQGRHQHPLSYSYPRPLIRVLKLLFPGLSLLLINFGFAASGDWTLKRDKDGIQVSIRSVAGSKHDAVRAEMEIDVALTELVGIMMDPSACPDWVALCKRSEIVNQDSATELHIYTLNDLPWPARDRDVVAHVVWSQDDTGKVTMQATLVAGLVPAMNKTLRLTEGTTQWQLIPVSSTRTRIVSEAHIDPGGATPAWLVNMLLIDSPHKTMKNLRALAQTGRYRGVSVEFLKPRAAKE